jgi:hypothetical protein
LSLTLCAVFIISSAFTALSAGEPEEEMTTVRGTLTILPPYVNVEKLVLLEAPEGVELHEKRYSEYLPLSYLLSPEFEKEYEMDFNYHVITGLNDGDKIKVEAYTSNPMLKTTAKEFTYTATTGEEPEQLILVFDINKTNQENSKFIPDSNANEPYELNISGNTVVIPVDSAYNLAKNNGKNGVQYVFDNAKILFSGSCLSYLSDLLVDFGLALKLKDSSFTDAEDVLDKLNEATSGDEDILETADKTLLFQLRHYKNLSEKVKIEVSREDLNLSDSDYSNVKAFYFNAASSSFKELETTYNPDNGLISFETDKTGYFAFALKREIPQDTPDNQDDTDDDKSEDGGPPSPDTGDSTAAHLELAILSISAGLIVLFKKRRILV